MNSFISRALMILALTVASHSARADLLYRLDINTALLAGTDGYIELSLGALVDAPLARVQIHSSSTDGLGAVAEQFGAVSGDLTSTLSLASDMGFADLLQHIQFGESLSLQLQLGGDWLTTITDSGLSLAIKLWSTDFLPLLSSDEFGDLLRLELVPGGSVEISALSEFASIQPLVAVPAPAGVAMLGVGLLLMSLRRRAGSTDRR